MAEIRKERTAPLESFAAALREADAYAIPLPWLPSDADDGQANHDRNAETLAGRHPLWSQHPGHIRLACLLRNAVPELLTLLETLQGALDQYEEDYAPGLERWFNDDEVREALEALNRKATLEVDQDVEWRPINVG